MYYVVYAIDLMASLGCFGAVITLFYLSQFANCGECCGLAPSCPRDSLLSCFLPFAHLQYSIDLLFFLKFHKIYWNIENANASCRIAKELFFGASVSSISVAVASDCPF